MSESRTVFIPAFSLNYDDNMLESVGIGGEMFRRDTPLHAENSRLKAENETLHNLIEALLQCVGETNRDKGCNSCVMYNGYKPDAKWCLLRPTLRGIGFDVSEKPSQELLDSIFSKTREPEIEVE